jgi:hypothetical protein
MPTYPDCSYVSVDDTSEPTGASYIYCLAAEVRKLKRAAADANDLAASFPIMEPFTECDPYWDNVIIALPLLTDAVPLVGSVTGSTVSFISGGPFDTGCADFSADNAGYVAVGSNAAFTFPPGSPFTIEFFVKSASYVVGTYLAFDVEPSPNWYIDVGSGTKLTFSQTASYVLSPNNLSTNVWHHIELTSDGTNWTSYCDGEYVASGAHSYTVGTDHAFYLGLWATYPSYDFNGQLCQFRVTAAQRHAAPFDPPTAPFYGVVCT